MFLHPHTKLLMSKLAKLWVKLRLLELGRRTLGRQSGLWTLACGAAMLHISLALGRTLPVERNSNGKPEFVGMVEVGFQGGCARNSAFRF
jgi:hypothetical protein